MIYYVTFVVAGTTQRLEFFTPKALFDWLQTYVVEEDGYPRHLCIYEANCLFDASDTV